MTVHCLFHNYCDYECAAETLIGVYLTQGDAETGLLEVIARGERLAAEDMAFNERFRQCHERNRDKHQKVFKNRHLEQVLPKNKKEDDLYQRFQEAYRDEIDQIVTEQIAWRKREFGHDCSDIPDRNIDNYSIEEIEVGKLRS